MYQRDRMEFQINKIRDIAENSRHMSFQGITMLFYVVPESNKRIELFHTRNDGEFDDILNEIGGITDNEDMIIYKILDILNYHMDNKEDYVGAIKRYLNDFRDRGYEEDLERARDMILN